jgi:hypothetical protein
MELGMVCAPKSLGQAREELPMKATVPAADIVRLSARASA